MSRSHLWFGPNGTGKTASALAGSTPEVPSHLMELEPGGYKRASAGMPLARGAVEITSLRVPATELEQIGEVKVTGQGNAMPQMAYRLEGWIEFVTQFNAALTAACKAGRRPIVDTATRLWLAQRQAFDQQIQEATGKDAEKLGQLRYTTPNARMIAMAEYAERFDLDLIMIAHEGTVFNSNPPQPSVDTMKEMENLADVVLRFSVRDSKPLATVWKGADGGMVLRGLEIPEPTLAKVNRVLDCAAAMRSEGQEVPKDTNEILLRGGLLIGEG